MTEQQRADRLLLAWLESEAPDQAPEGLLDRIDTATRSARPRPAWVARLEGHHMEIIEGGRRSGAPRLGVIFAIVAIVIAVLAAAAFVGTRLQPAPIAPAPSQRAVVSEASASPASTATPIPSFAMRTTQPGDPIPDELIGTWFAFEFNEYVYYNRAGDPFCVAHWRTTQDCLTFYGNNEFYRNGDIVTMVDGHLRFWPVGNDRCKDTANLVDYEKVGDEIHLTVLPDQCFTDMSDLRPVAPPDVAPTLPPY